MPCLHLAPMRFPEEDLLVKFSQALAGLDHAPALYLKSAHSNWYGGRLCANSLEIRCQATDT